MYYNVFPQATFLLPTDINVTFVPTEEFSKDYSVDLKMKYSFLGQKKSHTVVKIFFSGPP